MMIEVNNVSKFYGARQALDRISLRIASREMTGILGANGSGKSTLMRLLAGYLAPTNGRIRVDGVDPRINSAVRQKIGYLPEGTPLPPRMRVGEYLRYRAGLKGIFNRKPLKNELAMLYEKCPIKDLRDRLIVGINPNERQWVGIADCLLGGPELYLFDELTAGMDARNADMAKNLMKSLAESATVILTSRVLGDMEEMNCRVLVLEQARIFADNTLKTICKNHVEERTIILNLISPEPVREAFRSVPGVRTVAIVHEEGSNGEKTVRITIPAGVDLRQELSQICAKRGWIITGMQLEPVKLDDIFRKAVKR